MLCFAYLQFLLQLARVFLVSVLSEADFVLVFFAVLERLLLTDWVCAFCACLLFIVFPPSFSSEKRSPPCISSKEGARLRSV